MSVSLTLNLAIVSVLSRREEPPEGALAPPPPPFIACASARCAGRAALDIIIGTSNKKTSRETTGGCRAGVGVGRA